MGKVLTDAGFYPSLSLSPPPLRVSEVKFIAAVFAMCKGMEAKMITVARARLITVALTFLVQNQTVQEVKQLIPMNSFILCCFILMFFQTLLLSPTRHKDTARIITKLMSSEIEILERHFFKPIDVMIKTIRSGIT